MKTIISLDDMFLLKRDFSLFPLNNNEVKNFLQRKIDIKVLLEFRKEFSWLIVDTDKFLGMSNNYIHHLVVTEGIIETALSERLIKIIEVCLHGRSTFGNDEFFAKWLYSKDIAIFSGKKPLDFLYGDISDIEYINSTLCKIDHGIPA